MHIILGALTALVTIFYLLDRLGIDVGGLNPFYWYRRRAFAQKYGSDPIYSIDDKVHIAALLVIGSAKMDGDVTANQKAAAQRAFESELSLDTKEASQLFGSAAHLLDAPQLIDTQLGKLVHINKSTFTAEQADSIVKMMEAVASADGPLSGAQTDFIRDVRTQLAPAPKREGEW